MATRLIQIVPFVAVPASGTVPLPHQINVNGVPERPDFVAADASGFTVTVTATQVSVTNTGAAPADVNVWLELKHTTSRQLGAVPNTLYPSMTPRPFVVASGGSGGGGGGSTYAFVFQPGGAPHDNVFDDWALLMAAMGAISGPKLLQFDDQFAALLVPTGAWDQTDTVWEGIDKGNGYSLGPTTVQFDDGAAVTKLRTVRGLRLQCLGATAINDLDNGDVFILDDYAVIGGDTNPVIDLSSIAFFKAATLCVRHGSQVLQQGAPIIGLLQGLNVEVDKFALFEANTIDNGLAPSGFLSIKAHAGDTFANIQSFFGGNVQLVNSLGGFNMQPNSGYQLSSGLVNYFSLGGAQNANLVPALWHPGGMAIVKNTSGGGTVTITPSGGDTIDGAPTHVITTGQGSVILVSDGISNWMIVGEKI